MQHTETETEAEAKSRLIFADKRKLFSKDIKAKTKFIFKIFSVCVWIYLWKDNTIINGFKERS